MKAVGMGVRKKDAMALTSGKPVYVADIAPAAQSARARDDRGD